MYMSKSLLTSLITGGLCLMYSLVAAQSTVTVTKCVPLTPAFSTSSTPVSGTLVSPGTPITLTPGVDYPAVGNYRITDMYVEVTWSKTQGTCAAPAAGAVSLGEVGFGLTSPLGTTRYFAASNANSVLVGAAGATWGGTNQVLNVTTTFHDGSPNLVLGQPPVNGTFNRNGHSLSSLLPAGASADFLGDNPSGGSWTLVAVDDNVAPNLDVLCIHEYCVTFVLCNMAVPVNADCKASNILSIGANGTVTPNFATLNNASDTSCLLTSMTFAPAGPFTCANIGSTQNITMTLTDRFGTTDFCTSSITIVDTLKPNLTCKDYTVYLNAAGTFTFSAADSIIATDNCGLAAGGKRINGLSSITYNCANAGLVSTVTLTATDQSGNVASCNSDIYVLDTVPPVAQCRNITVHLNGTGTVTVNATAIDNGSTEVCPPIITRTIDFASSQTYTCANLGLNFATLTVGDVFGNTNSCQAQITVLDTVRPVANCATITADLSPAGAVTVPAASLDNASTDNCSVASFNIGGAASTSFNCSHVGTPQTVVLTVVDGSGNTRNCNATVNVADVTPPTANCQSLNVYVNGAGTVTVTASQINLNSSDVCAGTTLTYLLNGGSGVNFTCANIGSPQTVTLTATDPSGNSSTCNGTVNVFDTVAPNAICQPITVFLNAAGTVSVTPAQINNASTDNCAITTSTINGGASVSYNCTHVAAVQTATLRVQDAAGNFDECTSAITVRDTVRPSAICQNATLILSAAGTATATPATINNGSSDACGVATTTINGGATVAYTCANLGANTATLTVTDVNGNSRTCTSTITVTDNTAPVAVCQNRTVYLAPTSVTVTAAQINGGSSDNCAIANLFINNQPSVTYTCANLGNNTATLRVTDASGGQATCNATVTVLDTVRPNALCLGSLSVSLGVSGVTTVLPSAINNSSTDNCGGLTYLINGAASVDYNCSNVPTSPNVATLTVTDASGNSRTCTTQITVQDAVVPDANCTNGTFYLDASGQAVVDAVDIGSTSTDNCPPPSLTINGFVATSHTYTCSNLGANTATIVAQDNSGNTDVCTATVTIADTIDPVANCNATFNAFIGSAGTVTVAATAINNGSTDNCGIASFNLNGATSHTFNCSNIGANNQTLNVLDASGNTASCATVITVADTTRPTALCQNRTVTLGAAGTGSVTATQINNGSSDNCSTITLSLNAIGNTTINYNCTNVGTSTVTLIVRDNSGNQRTCNATVTVVDATAPNAVCQSGVNVYLNGTGTAAVTPAMINGGSTDNCGIASSSVNPTSFNCSQVGTQAVTLTLTDVNSNTSTCNTTVTVVDTVRPTMSCQPQTLTLSATGTATLTPSMINLGSSDNCGTPTFLISEGGGAFASTIDYTCASAGPHTITLQGTDASGNVATCNAVVTVQDVTLPTAICQNITVPIGPAGNVTVLGTQLNNGSTDNCSPLSFFINTIGNTDTVFTCANIGNRNLTLIVRDVSGNQATCLSTVTVVDNTNPTALCQSGVQVFLTSTGAGTLTPAQINNGSSDNCSVASVTVAPTSFTCSQVGPQTVTLTVTDASSNSSTCTTTITVRDTVKPTMVCNNTTLTLNAAGSATLLPATIGAGSTDACSIATRLIREGASGPFTSSIVYNCAAVGLHTVTVQATDVNGNVNTCNSTVTVQDITPPTAACQNITANIGAAGNVTVLATQINNNSTDNCGVSTLSINTVGNIDTVFTCANIGNRQLTLIVRDASGNQSTCTATVNVVDVLAPTAACQNATVYLNGTGTVTVTPANVNNGSSDNCTSLTLSVSPNTFDCNNVGGTNNVILTVTDASGNTASCNAVVDVQDTVTPVMVCKMDTVFLGVTGFVSEPATEINGGTTDNCGISSLLIRGGGATGYSSNVLFDCSDLGLQPVTLQATDIYGNVDSCQTTVLVRDNLAPTAICNTPITLNLTAAGTLTVPASTFDGGSTDNCSAVTFLINNQPNITFNCAQISTNQNLTLRVTDAAGNSSTCSVVADINDVTAPVAICKTTQTVNLSFANGTATLNAITINNGSTDACGPLSFLINNQPSFVYTCANLGSNTATLTVTDGSGNQSTCTTNVIVNDIHSPTASCQTNVTLPLSAAGTASFPVSSANLNSTDNCGITTYFQTGTGLTTVNYSCANLGNNILNVTMQDASGNSATCVTVVQVIDNIAPTPDCFNAPIQVFLNAAGSVTVPAIALDSNSTDNCAITTRLINGAATQQYTCSNLGLVNATLTVRDASNNSATCVAQIQVRDTIDPTAICKNVVATLNSTGTATVAATSINNLSTDNCGVTSLLINGAATATFTCANVGVNNAVLTVADASGNTSTCISQVTVQDITMPIVNCSNTTVYLDANGTVDLLPSATATGSDNCSIVTWQINGKPFETYTCSQVAAFQPATISATDVGGNTATCTAFITVEDTISPVANCSNVTVQLPASGTVAVNAASLATLSTDNCGIMTVNANGQPSITFTCANVGNNAVLVTVIDSSNNASACIATITVEDNIDPVANCVPNLQVQLGSAGTAVISASSINNNSTDNCSPLTFTFVNGASLDTFNCSNVGNNAAILLVTDPSGNQSFCASIIQVVDLTPPTANCQNLTAYLNSSGTVTVQDFELDNDGTPSADNCSIFNFHINAVGNSAITYNCANVGANTVNFIVQDPYNNYDTCVSTITVVDTTAPVVTCSNASFNLSNTGPFQLTPAMLNVSVNEACLLDTVFVAPDSITCADEGTFQVMVTAVDVNGNSGFCVSDVTVVIEDPAPTTDAPAASPVCEGSTITLFGNPPAGVYTYQWTGPNGFSSTAQDTVVTLSAAGVHDGWYYLEIIPTNGQGCPGYDSVEVGVNVVLPPTLQANSPLCEGYDAVLNVTNANTYVGSTISYAWSFNGAPLINNNDTLTIPSVTLANEGDYVVMVTVDGCTDIMAVPFFLNVNELPAAPQPAADTICEGSDLTVFANPPAGNYTYSWSGPNGFTSTTENPVLTAIALGDQGTYSVTITNDSTCASSATVQIVVKPIPVQPTISYNQPLCVGDILELVDTTTYIFPPFYVWTMPDNSQDTTTIPQLLVSNAAAGTYSMFVDMVGCVSTADAVVVEYEPVPSAMDDAFTVAFRDSLMNISLVGNDTSANAFIITIVDTTDNGVVVNNNDGTIDYKPNYSFFGSDTLYYAICDANCPNSCDTAMVVFDINTDFECFIPNAMSPNGDGINDTWNVRCVHDYPNAELRLFSRWGTLVYEGSLVGFNAQFKGKDLPDGSYFYVLKLNDTTHVNKDRFSGYLIIQR